MPENNYHYEEVAEIMVSSPGWGLKWGNLIIITIVCTILSFAYFFNYPDVLKIPVDFSSTTSAVILRSPPVNYGIDTFFVSNGASVKPGDSLMAWYDADYTDYTALNRLENILLQYQANAGGRAAGNNLHRQIKELDMHRLGAFKYDGEMLAAGHIEKIGTVLQKISDWKQKWISTASIAGSLTVNGVVSPVKTSISPRQAILYIQPPDASFIAHGWVPNKLYGRIKARQRVSVSINEVNGQKFNGHVISISPLSDQAKHDVYIQLDHHQGLNLTFTGEARILLNDKTLLQRLLGIN